MNFNSQISKTFTTYINYCFICASFKIFFLNRNPFGFYNKWVIPKPHRGTFDQSAANHSREAFMTEHIEFLEANARQQTAAFTEAFRQLQEQLSQVLMRQGNTEANPEANPTGSSDLAQANLSNIAQVPLNVSQGSQGSGPSGISAENKRPKKQKLVKGASRRNAKKGKSGTVVQNPTVVGKRSNRKKKTVDETYVPEASEAESDEDSENDFLTDEEEGSETFQSTRSQPVSETQLTRSQSQGQNFNPPIPIRLYGDGDDDIVYVTELMLDLLGDPVDNFTMINSKDECPLDYMRLQITNGFLNTLHSNHVTYDAYMHGSYICGFDLSCSGEGANDQYSIPSVRQGKHLVCCKLSAAFLKFYLTSFAAGSCHLTFFTLLKKAKLKLQLHKIYFKFFFLGTYRVRINFSKPPRVDLTLLMWAESTALLEIPSSGKIRLSYLPK